MSEYGLGSRGFTGNRSTDGRMIDAISLHSNVTNSNIQWIPFTPTLTGQGGATFVTVANSAAYLPLFRTLTLISFQTRISTSTGTGKNALILTFPDIIIQSMKAPDLWCPVGFDILNAKVVAGQAGNSSLFLTNYDGTFPSGLGGGTGVSWISINGSFQPTGV